MSWSGWTSSAAGAAGGFLRAQERSKLNNTWIKKFETNWMGSRIELVLDWKWNSQFWVWSRSDFLDTTHNLQQANRTVTQANHVILTKFRFVSIEKKDLEEGAPPLPLTESELDLSLPSPFCPQEALEPSADAFALGFGAGFKRPASPKDFEPGPGQLVFLVGDHPHWSHNQWWKLPLLVGESG